MSDVDLHAAVEAVSERKQAAVGAGDPGEMKHLGDGGWRLMTSDFDVDLTEACVQAMRVVIPAQGSVALRLATPTQSLVGCWLDGLVTGLMLARLRDREGVR